MEDIDHTGLFRDLRYALENNHHKSYCEYALTRLNAFILAVERSADDGYFEGADELAKHLQKAMEG